MQRPDEGMDARPTDRSVRIAFGLHIYPVDAERILRYDTVDSLIVRSAAMFEGGALTAVSHGGEQLEHQEFEEFRRLSEDSFQQIVSDQIVRELHACGNGLDRSGLILGARLRFVVFRCLLPGLSGPILEFDVFGVPAQIIGCDHLGRIGKELPAW